MFLKKNIKAGKVNFLLVVVLSILIISKINAENLNFDLKNKTLDISAIENSQVNVNLLN